MNLRQYRSAATLAAIILLVGIGLIYSCSNDTDTVSLQGEKLVQQYCGSCHMSVTADMLTKDKWINSVLPAMAPKLGIKVYQDNQYYPNSNTSAISFEKWTRIVDYFKENAPEKLKLNETSDLSSKDFSLFSVRKPQWVDSLHNVATTSLIAFNPFKQQIYSSDATNKRIYRWDENLKPTIIKNIELSAVDVSFINDTSGDHHGVFTSIGNMQAVAKGSGKVIDLNFSNNYKLNEHWRSLKTSGASYGR